jgi:catechol 2,3-dioxygenase-like lactoylglutathione lyase family enzyme
MASSLDRAITRASDLPPLPEPHFLYVQMNVIDPHTSARFYVDAFPGTEYVELAGLPAIRSGGAHIRFNRVDAPASNDWNVPLWHVGWGSPDVSADHERLAGLGIEFFRVPGRTGHFYSPDRIDVEISRNERSRFDHVHLMSDAPLTAGDWYVTVLGLRRGEELGRPADGSAPKFTERAEPANQIHGPSSRVYAGDILLFAYPNQHVMPFTATPKPEPVELVSNEGHVIDHIGLLVPDLDTAEARMCELGVPIIEARHSFGTDGRESIMIQGPDRARIALIGA